MRFTLLCLVLLTLDVAVAGPEKVEVPRAGAVDLKALADRIDPGEIEPWLSKLPRSFRAALARAREAEGVATGSHGERPRELYSTDTDWLWSALLFADILEEAYLEAPDEVSAQAEGVLAMAYRSLGGPMLRNEIWAAFLGASLERIGVGKSEIEPFLRDASRNAGRLFRALAARILRRDRDPWIMARVLGALACDEKDMDASLRLMEEAIRLVQTRVSATAWFSLAEQYYRALKVAHGDVAAERGRRLAEEEGTDVTEEVESALDLGICARGILALEGKNSDEDRLTRASLLVRLKRIAEAEELYTVLVREMPRDARPRVGLARLVLTTEGQDIQRARKLIASAKDLEHRDALYWEVAVSVEFYVFLLDVADWVRPGCDGPAGARAARDRLKPSIEALRRSRPGLAGVLLVLLDGLPDVLSSDESQRAARLRGMATRALPKFAALAARVPDEPQPYRFLCTSALFGMDADASFLALEAPVPAWGRDDAQVLLRRARTHLALVVRWGRADRFEAFEKLLEQAAAAGAPRSETHLLRGGARAVLARMSAASGGATAAEEWKIVEKHYRGVADSAVGVEASVALDGVAVALAEQERYAAARSILEEAERMDPENAAVFRYNRAVCGILEGVKLSEARRSLESLANSDWSSEIQAQSRAWLGVLARRDGANGKAKAWFKGAREAREDAPLATGGGWNVMGVLVVGDTHVKLGISAQALLVLDLELACCIWPILPAPITEQDLKTAPKK